MSTQEWQGPPWEPPLAGTADEHLLAALDRQRATFRWKADGLDAEGLAVRLAPSEVTLGGLLKHLARVESDRFSVDTTKGAERAEPWASAPWGDDPDWEWHTAAGDSPEQLYTWYDEAVARAQAQQRTWLTDGGLDAPSTWEWPSGESASRRRLLFDLLEEYGRHTGHADLIREAVDGRVGEDPPWDG